MKHILFIYFLTFALKVNSHIENGDIQEDWDKFWDTLKPHNSDLTMHPDTGLNISQFLEKYDYPLEYHDVITKDGFILTLHRIPHGKNVEIEKIMANKTKPVTFMVHCLACSSMDFIWQGPNISLAFLLADLGYDVWLANGRGNVHSMRHQTLSPNDKSFWDYSFHEKGFYDMPASIDYILNYTNLDNLTYIGHSQGTTEGLVLTSTKPEYNDKINFMILMSPIVYLENIRSPLILLINKYDTILKVVLDVLNIHGLAYNPVLPLITKTFCHKNSPFQKICIAIIEVIVGFDIPQIDQDTLTVFLTNTPNGVSVKEIEHFGQEIRSGYFRQYDYGRINNLIRYGSMTPPSYDLSKITVPVAAYYGKNDYLGGVLDVKKLLSELPREPVENCLIEYDAFNHLDFVTAKDVKKILYDKIIEDLQKYIPVI